jgi:phosphoribosylamine--glycine ligase
VEYNCRFGDPETQAVVPRMDFDLGEVMAACAEGNLEMAGPLKWKKDPAACVVLASAGYPEKAESGRVVTGLESASAVPGVVVFQASTQGAPGGRLVSAGGRVLGVSATGGDLKQALSRAYEAVGMIHFEGMQYRKDIGARALNRG